MNKNEKGNVMRRYFKRIIPLLMLAALLSGCSSNSGKEKIVVGTNAEFPPFEYINDDGDIDGFDMAVMKAIGDEMGYEVTFKNMEFKSLLGALQTGGIDVAAAGMTVTEERKQSVDFTDSYYTATQYIVVQKDSTITQLSDLNGKKIAVQEGTTGDFLVTPEESDVITDTSTVVKRFKKGADAILQLKNGAVDAVVIDKNPAEEFVKVNSDDLKCIPETTSTEQYAIAIAKGNDKLLSDLNKGLETIKENGTFDKLVDTYINGTSTTVIKESDNPFVNFGYKFERVFIDTKGYRLIIKGLFVTIGISLAAVLFGTMLGFIAAIMKLTESRKGHKTVYSVIANTYIDIIRGTPSVVQLLIMYNIIFNSHFGVVAAVLTFGINSGAYVAEIIRAGILAVDHGQMEAGRSLGFSYGQTMKYIVVPQAVKNILPALGNEFITLIKETAIVGYVAIQDLTKAADFLVSRTFEAFLPLIAIAIIYYCLIKILSKLLNKFERRLRRSDLR